MITFDGFTIPIIFLTLVLAYTVRRFLSNHSRIEGPKHTKGVPIEKLLSAEVRKDHVEFNKQLHKDFPGQPVIPVTGSEPNFYLVHTMEAAMEVTAKSEYFSSNPWVDGRLVALNTMNKEDHDRVAKTVKRFYAASRVKNNYAEVIDRAFTANRALLHASGDLVQWAKRVHMYTSLCIAGIAMDPKPDLIDRFIRYNDVAVRLVSPLGGIGHRPELSSTTVLNFIKGLVASVRPTLRMVMEIGLWPTLQILRPDLSLMPTLRPYMHVWEYPHLLAQAPEYFLALNEALQSPMPGTPAESLKAAVLLGTISTAEALIVMVQLMVNMTAANGMLNLAYRISNSPTLPKPDDEEGVVQFCKESMRLEPALMRNPRCVIKEGATIGGVDIPKGSLLLIMIGAANIDKNAFGEDAAEFKPSRKTEVNSLSFGSGLHYCLGRYLTETQARAAYRELVSSDGTGINVDKSKNNERVSDVDVGNYGWKSLHATVDSLPT
ncbi:hypothetical protein FOL47_006076 [Perkinsus chesapeaki]|uniref:Cytochrome P450 n=1 Tax=Perkinsus chesapeaki TaxID=330153 RepID=A0A7J6LU35_PERCH|nr:hypothetical protein FOL47_006076 [Perkinsus chesapeaki]